MIEKYAKWLSITVPLAWGTSYVFMKFGMTGASPITIVALRCGIAFAITATIFFERLICINRKTLFYSAIAGALLFGVFICLLYGVDRTSASEAGFLQSTTVVIVPVLQAIISKKVPKIKIVIGASVVLVGLFIMNGGSFAGINTGGLYCLFSALIYAVHIILTKRFVSEINSLCLGICQLGFAAIYAIIAAFLLESPKLPQNVMQWGSILGLALICSAYGFVMQAVIQKYVTPESTGFMFSFEPIFSAVFAFIFLQERLKIIDYAGAVLIFIGVLIANSKLACGQNNDSKIKEVSICHLNQ